MRKSAILSGRGRLQFGHLTPLKRVPMGLALALALGACGGGADGTGSGASSNDSTYYGVTGVKNGSSTTICLENAAFVDPQSANGKGVTANIVAYYGLTGSISSLSGTGQSCASKFPLASTNISVSLYNSVVIPGAATAGGSGGGTGGSTGDSTGGSSGGSTGGSTPTTPVPGSSLQYISWNGSSNGEVLRDSDNKYLAVGASDRNIYFLGTGGSPTKLTGLTVDSGANIINSSARTGYIGLADANGGGKIAVLFCTNGSLMNISVTSTWTASCGGANAGSGGTSGGNTGGSGGSGGAGSGGGSVTRTFIDWTNSANGNIVKDANNESFSFYTDSRCLYSYNKQQETSNFCLGSGFSGSFAGRSVQVTLAAATSGGCIAVLADPSGFQIDIVTSSAGAQTVNIASTKWVTTGCTR